MKINAIEKIANDSGDYLLFVDYGSDGLQVVEQWDDPKDALMSALSGSWGGPCAVLKVVEFKLTPASSEDT